MVTKKELRSMERGGFAYQGYWDNLFWYARKTPKGHYRSLAFSQGQLDSCSKVMERWEEPYRSTPYQSATYKAKEGNIYVYGTVGEMAEARVHLRLPRNHVYEYTARVLCLKAHRADLAAGRQATKVMSFTELLSFLNSKEEGGS